MGLWCSRSIGGSQPSEVRCESDQPYHMNIVLRVNNDIEGYDLVDMDSNQSHDGDGACEVIATVYTEEWATKLQNILNMSAVNSESPAFFKRI